MSHKHPRGFHFQWICGLVCSHTTDQMKSSQFDYILAKWVSYIWPLSRRAVINFIYSKAFKFKTSSTGPKLLIFTPELAAHAFVRFSLLCEQRNVAAFGEYSLGDIMTKKVDASIGENIYPGSKKRCFHVAVSVIIIIITKHTLFNNNTGKFARRTTQSVSTVCQTSCS